MEPAAKFHDKSQVAGIYARGCTVGTYLGRAGEYLTCAELSLQGWNAVLAGEGLPYDVLAWRGTSLHRIQVKATSTRVPQNACSKVVVPIHRFSRSRGRAAYRRRLNPGECDWLALVALDCRKVAFVPIDRLVRDGRVVAAVQLKSHDFHYDKSKFGVDPNTVGLFFEDLARFTPKE